MPEKRLPGREKKLAEPEISYSRFFSIFADRDTRLALQKNLNYDQLVRNINYSPARCK